MKTQLIKSAALTALITISFLKANAQVNPVITGADPDAITVGKEYWVYPTNGSDTGRFRRDDRFFGYSSPDMVHWQNRGELINIKDISWIKDDSVKNHGLWAPDVLEHKGKFYLYYSVGPQNPKPSRLGVAVSDYPNKDFKDSGKPLLTGGDHFEAIDPMVYDDPKTKKSYLYTGGSAGSTLRVFELKKNMVEIDHEIKVDQPPHFTEGVFMHERNGIYYLSYSHGSYNNATYSVHYAMSKSPLGPWDYKGAILVSDATHKGPGHHAFVMNPKTKEWFIIYHRWDRTDEKGPFRGVRRVAIEKLTYNADGTIVPVVMTDSPPPSSPIK